MTRLGSANIQTTRQVLPAFFSTVHNMGTLIKIFGLSLMGVMILLGLHHTGFMDVFFNQKFNEPTTNRGETKEPLSPYGAFSLSTLGLETLEGEVFSWKEQSEKVFLLNFWASWCAPCWEEFPELISAVRWFKGHVVLLAISNDSSKEDIKAFLKNLEKAGVQWEQEGVYILWDPEFKLAERFSVAKWPETFILNQEGQVVKKQVGVFSFQSTKVFLSELLSP